MSHMNLLTATSPDSDATHLFFKEIGENPLREGLLKTPERFARAMREMTSGYKLTPELAVGEGLFESESNGPVCVKEIEFFSLCEHHILPFWGHASIAYLPDQKILGLSKLGRIVEVFARRLQVQERLTAEIGEAIRDLVSAKAVAVTISAQHMCMMMRGVRKINSHTKTEFLWKNGQVNDFEFHRMLEQLK